MQAPDSCTDCGFVYAEVVPDVVTDRLLLAVEQLGPLIVEAGPAAVGGSDPSRWTPLEYAGHVRDVLLSIRERVVLAAILDHPVGTPIYREQRIAAGLGRLDTPSVVAGELVVAAGLLGRTLAALPPGADRRTMTYSAQTPFEVSIAWLAAQAVHEAEHHLDDVKALLPAR